MKALTVTTRGTKRPQMSHPNANTVDIEFLHTLVREVDIAKFFHIAAEGVARLLGADGAALIVKEEPDLLRYWFFHGLPANYKHLSIHAFNDRLGVAGAALHAGKPVLVTDYPHSSYALPEYIKTGLQTSLCSPVMADGKVLAVLAIAWFSPLQKLPDAGDYNILQIVSDFMGAALYRFRIEARLRDLAMHDALTGAANRHLFFNRLEHAMAMAQRRDRLIAVIVFDIDNFKMVNDRFGHPVGDALLIEVPARINDLIRRGDTLARLGGDEFAVILEDVRCYADVETIIERIRQALHIRWGTLGTGIAISASLGAMIYPFSDCDGPTLLHNADAAMYEAKRAGGNQGVFYCNSMARINGDDSHLISEFLAAIGRQEMVLHFQPVVEIASGEVVAAEALLRWQHPTRGLLGPEAFMVALEHPYNSLKLDQWVVTEAIAALARWQARGIFKKLYINLSASSVENHRFCETLRGALAASPVSVDPHYLGIELVEWSTIRNIESARRLIMDCKALGVSVTLDDFGTGFASLQHLRLLPINAIKIDRSFISGLTINAADRILVQSMLGAANAFGIISVAEGIESEDQRSMLIAMGCIFGQGYLFAQPLPENRLWLAPSRQSTVDPATQS